MHISSFCRFAFAVVAAAVVNVASAEVLVSEGFAIGSDDGCYSTTDKTSLSYNLDVAYTQSTGFATNKWQSTTSVIVSRTSGLSFPASLSDRMAPAGGGAIGLAGSSSGPNWSSSSGVSQEDLYRNQRRKIVSLNGSAGEKRYFRALMYADSDVLSQLSTSDTWLSWRTGYSLGIATPPADITYYSSIMNCSRYMHFSFYRNASTGKYEMSFTVKGTEGTAKRVTLDSNVTAGHTYLVVAEITLGDGADTLRAFSYDCTNDAGLDVNNISWVDADSSVSYTLVDGTDDLCLFLGGQYMTTGTLKFDEICIGTELGDVLPVSDTYVSVNGCAIDNLAATSVDVSATVGMKNVASATPTLYWGTSEDGLDQSASLDAVTEAGAVTNSLSGLDPMTTYYYKWVVSATGVDSAETSVESFTTKGAVVFGDVTTGGYPSTGGVWASVDVSETGIGTTTVTCYCGETADSMEAIGTWEDVRAGDTLVATNTAAAWGTTYLFKFVSSFEYNSQAYATETSATEGLALGIDILKTTASGSWLDGSNWSLDTPPNSLLSACISNVTTLASLYLSDADAVVKSLSIKNGKAAVDLRGSSTMTLGSISFGDANVANINNGQLSLTGGVVTVNGNVSIPSWRARSSYNTLDINGTAMDINGALTVSSGNDSGGYNYFRVNPGSVLTITNGLTISYTGYMEINGGIVTNKSNLVVGNNAKVATMTLRNGAYFRQPWASNTGVGGKSTATLNILGGSTFDASGASMRLGSGDDGSYSSSSMLVSNSTFKTANYVSPLSSRSLGNYTTTITGSSAVFSATGNVTLGPTSLQANKRRDSGSTRMNVDGGAVEVGETLCIGGTCDYAMNYLTVSGATATMELGSLTCCTNATVKFVIPDGGFSNATVIHVNGAAALAEDMPPIYIDATACKSCPWVTLLEANGGITNLTEDNLASRVVLVEEDGHKTLGDRPYNIKLITSGEVVTALKFRVAQSGLAILVR